MLLVRSLGRALVAACGLLELGFTLLATRGTASFLSQNGVEVTPVNKVMEGRPHIVDTMKDGDVHLVINTTQGEKSLADSKSIRRSALMDKIPYYTTLAGAEAAVAAIGALGRGKLQVSSLQEYESRRRA